MLPKIVSFDSGNREILEIILPGSGKGIDISASLKKTFDTAKRMNRSVAMFDYPFYNTELAWSPEKSRREDIETLVQVLHSCNAIEYQKIRLIGKSSGGIVAVEYLSELSGIEQKKYDLVILGFVVGEIDLRNVYSDLTIIQGSGDTYGSIDEIKEEVKKSKSMKVKLHEIGRSTHNFKDVLTGEPTPYDLALDLIFQKKESEVGTMCGREDIGIVPVFQKFDYDCGGAAVNNLLTMIGKEDVAKNNLYVRMDVNPEDGTKSQNIKKLLNEEGISYIETNGADLEDLEMRLRKNKVCLVCYQAWGTEEEMNNLDSGHYSVVYKIDEIFVWVLDPTIESEEVPGDGKGIVRYKKDDFEKRWNDKGSAGELYNHWMLAV